MKKFRAPEQVGNRHLTPAWAMTASRPFLMFRAMRSLHRGDIKSAFKNAAVSALSDYESPVAALTEHFFPGWGFSRDGAKGDQGSDSITLSVAAIGVLTSRRVHWLARLGMGLVAVQEVKKARQAQQIISDYRELTGTKGIPDIKSTETGKVSMAKKLAFVAGATATATDTLREHPVLQALVGTGTLALAIDAVGNAETARGEYHTDYFDNIRPQAMAARVEPALPS